ncbi:aminotransferase class V-fold PLP-dependent enzyme [Paenibacillus bouchesdurhonensis]|uniref:aminotransferase class V-fold PLP-dependent enzyme n=1 Tax=Paenibacillus bouchesdurhonensis TaxID=1870990 RepID=UPI000DA6077D|nr:aminotransferase class V-fold PLP-dependent enzyme [Paenibacillus bouchesdurhonensis]
MEKQSVIYFDHAATSWPKPPAVGEAMMKILNGQAASAGRGNHNMALQAGRVMYNARRSLATLFHISNPNDIVFTSNTTAALNLAIKGWLKPGDHVIATMVEHNSVRRPLEYLKRVIGIEVDYVSVNDSGQLDMEIVRTSFRPETTLVICSHSSNLLGSIMPLYELGRLAREHGAIFLVDAAQTAGTYPIHVAEMGIDLLAFPGHKGLLGPQGTGGLYISPQVELEPLLHGGTGSQSEELEQPTVRPDRYEAGTANTVGIAGLAAGVNVVLEYGAEQIYERQWQLVQFMMEELAGMPGISLLGPKLGEPRTGLLSYNVAGRDAAEVAFLLDREYGIAVRAGYHCTPLGHMAAGTSEGGAVRASVGFDTTEKEVESFVLAMRKISDQ